MANIGTIKYKNGSSWIDILHPVNSFYFSCEETSPSELFGGTWTRITGGAIRGMEENKVSGYISADTHTLTISEMPTHYHSSPKWIVHDKGSLGYGTSGHLIPSEWNDASTLQSTFASDFMNMNNTGGGWRTQLCSAPSTVSSGIERLKILTSFGGEIYV